MTEVEARLRHARVRFKLAGERYGRVYMLMEKGGASLDDLHDASTEVNDAQLELDLAEIAASAPSPRR